MTARDMFSPSQTGLTQFIRLPLPPSMNSYWLRSPHGMFLSAAARKYRQEVAEIVAECECLKFGSKRLYMAVRLCMRDKRRADIDNRTKALLDALAHAGVFDDDEQIDELLLLRGPIVKGGDCYVMISEREQ